MFRKNIESLSLESFLGIWNRGTRIELEAARPAVVVTDVRLSEDIKGNVWSASGGSFK